MLGRERDDVIALRGVHFGDAFDREIIGFGRAAREDDLLRIGANGTRNRFARMIDRFLRLPAEGMVPARRVAEIFGEVWAALPRTPARPCEWWRCCLNKLAVVAY